MGVVKAGDTLFDEQGQVCRVLQAHMVHLGRPCYQVRFSDGSKIVCDEDHLWTLQRREKLGYKQVTLATKALASDLFGKSGARYSIATTKPLQIAEQRLPIAPYLLGIWLGDGSCGSGTITTMDQEVVDAFVEAGFLMVRHGACGQAYSYQVSLAGEERCIKDGTTGRFVSTGNTFHSQLKNLGVLRDKHIPTSYMRGSEDQRRSLLQGLLDSDGSAGKTTSIVEFCSVKSALAEQVCELANSLGYKAVIYCGRSKLYGEDHGPSYRVCFIARNEPPLFRIQRKQARLKPARGQSRRAFARYVVAVERVPSVPVRCITVDSASRLYLAGPSMIATHNTRTGAEFIREEIETGRMKRVALIGATSRDVRKVMVEGESGLLAVCPPWNMPRYEPSNLKLIWPNGAEAHLYSADEPDRLRGPQHDGFWGDEIAAWRYAEAWDMLMFGLRLGLSPRGIATTTPRPIKLIRDLLAAPTTAVTKGKTDDNADNLAKVFIDTVISKYRGTRLGRQELDAEVLDDVPGALWTYALLERTRASVNNIPGVQRDEMSMRVDWVTRVRNCMTRIVVSIDPSGSDGPLTQAQKKSEEGRSNDIGIVVCGLGRDGHAYVLEDLTINASPAVWARVAVDAFYKWRADLVVAEVNFGGAMVQTTVRGADGKIPFKAVHASRGKHVRAQPVSSLYEQGKAHNLGTLPELETQMTMMTTHGFTGPNSPDRLDAAVWGITELMLANTVMPTAMVGTVGYANRGNR